MQTEATNTTPSPAPLPSAVLLNAAAPESPKDSLTFKLAPQVREALDRKAAQWGQSAPEFMRAFLNYALHLPDGLTLKLDAAGDVQGELPLK